MLKPTVALLGNNPTSLDPTAPPIDAIGHAPKSTAVLPLVQHVVSHSLQFGGGYLLLQWLEVPFKLHALLVTALVVWLVVMLFMGPSYMTPRRKLMIASFGAPDSGIILGTLSMDMTKTLPYIQQKRKETGEHITITHVVLRAVGAALANAPSVNGHIVFGNYYTAPAVDVSCVVSIDGGRDLGVCRLPSIDKMPLSHVAQRVQDATTRLRAGRDRKHSDRNLIWQVLPTYVIRPLVALSGWLGGCLGLSVAPLGIEPYMFGGCVVTSVGMMGLEHAYAPFTPFAQAPVLLTVGAIKDTPVAVDGNVVVRPVLTVTTTIDHRYVDGPQGARMALQLRRLVEDPSLLEPLKL
ncbi:hypothetical protein P43SY_000385 [Pythium insidiosum]|uniref:dihydrolipoyllysine-residue succinyltransferase n=1 Tax=Pythium insidiosum TaxID=114742 RepID=A0AAD5QDE6_PYTIN|nr:hypothetical protein P43SY_000385 [Pythium insidiosum]